MKFEKKDFYVTLLLMLLPLITISLISYYFDPLQMFRKSDYYITEGRKINYGIAKNHDYELVVLGTSTSQNILKKDIENIFGVEGVNLSISGSTSYEQRELLKVILKEDKVKKIIYGLDIFSFNREINEVRINTPEYVTRDGILHKFKYLYSFDSLKNIQESKKDKNWIENHGYWGKKHKKDFTRERLLNINVVQNKGSIDGLKKGYSLSKMENNLKEFLKLVDSNKNVKYEIYLPPYSSMYWYFADKYDTLDSILEFKQFIFSEVQKRENIKIYDFQVEFDVIESFDNYKDMVHYTLEVNRNILLDINKGIYLSDFKKNKENEKIFIERLKSWKLTFDEIYK
ncbi:MAG: hypothetical protein ACRCY7_11395 [Cetobacterium sp.]|uniref:hypothetical protein n=1 Tax=Cetobacterium sp. TaxID=2071632 RepID=UPI003F2CC132